MKFRLPGGRGPISEARHRTRQLLGAQFFTSRHVVRDHAIVVKRFPLVSAAVPPADIPERSFVLVHGIGVSSRYFQPVAAHLARVAPVYLIDLPGYGAAPNPRSDVSLDDHANVVIDFLKTSGITNPVLIGHSMGAQVVARIATDAPDVSDRIVLLAPTMTPSYRPFWIAASRLILDMLMEPFPAKWVVASDYVFRTGVPYYFKQVPHLLGDRIEDRVPLITAPTLVLRGNRDVIVSNSWARELADALPDGTFCEVDGPHVIMYSDPVSVAAHIAEHARARLP